MTFQEFVKKNLLRLVEPRSGILKGYLIMTLDSALLDIRDCVDTENGGKMMKRIGRRMRVMAQRHDACEAGPGRYLEDTTDAPLQGASRGRGRLEAVL
jgi:hypothetical protein